MTQANTYSIGDATAFVRGLKGIVRGIATSPPYNKGRKRKPSKSDNWRTNKLQQQGYASFDDDMPNADYVAWQRDFLEACIDAIGHDGVLLYNTGRMIRDKREDRREAIVSGFPVRQTIVWNRGSSNNQGGRSPTIFPPIYELIYVIAGDGWHLPKQHLAEFRKWGDVWRVNFEIGTEHPAPFPVELARRMCMTVGGAVADPFAGSGTVGVAARALGYDYYLNDISPEYRDMFQARIDTPAMLAYDAD